MPLIKSRSDTAFKSNVREMVHAGHPIKQALAAAYRVKRGSKQGGAIQLALSTARKYADGGDVEELQTPEGYPFLQARGPVPTGDVMPSPGQPLYQAGRSAVQRLTEPPPIKTMEPPDTSVTPPQETMGGIGKEVIQGFNPLRWFEQPPVQDLPPDAYKGKVPPNQLDWIEPVAAGLEAGSNLIGIPSMIKAGISKAAIAFGAKMAAQQATKKALTNPWILAKFVEEPGYLDTSKFQKVGHQLGYMPGGVYTDPASKTTYYLKQAPSIEQAKNEHLGAKIYALAGTPVADVNITNVAGQPGIASKFLPNSHQLSEAKVPYDQIEGLYDNFVVDAWLANHDAVGTGSENPLGNIMISNGKAFRIDSGGSLRFKGSGDPKKHFNDHVDEIDSMRSYDFSKRSADVFHGVTDANLMVGAQKVADVDPQELSKLIVQYGPSDEAEKQALLTKLLKRREDIMNRFGVKPKWEAKPVETMHPAEPAPDDWWQQAEQDIKNLPIEDDRMVKEKDFSQGSLPPEERLNPNEIAEMNAAIDSGYAPSKSYSVTGGSRGPLYPHASASSPFEGTTVVTGPQGQPLVTGNPKHSKFSATAAAQELKPSLVDALFAKGELDKKTAKAIVKDLVPSLSPPHIWVGDEPERVAAYIWQIAEHAGPHKAEAVFRALPDTASGTRQQLVGPILSSLKKELGSSPWDDMSGGKYLVAKAISYKPMDSGKYSDLKINIVKQIIGKAKKSEPSVLSDAEKKKQMILKGQEKAKKSYVADPKAEVAKILAETGGDEYKIAGKIYAKANYNPLLADEIFKALPEDYNNVAAELNHLIEKRKYDPWEAKPGKMSTVNKIAGDMEKVDWQSYKPAYHKDLPPIEWGPVSKMIISSLGFGTEFALYHGKSTISSATAKEFGLTSKQYGHLTYPIPVHKRYPEELSEPTNLKPYEQAFFLSDKQHIAKSYGPNVLPFVARPKKVLKINWDEINDGHHGYNGDLMARVIEAGRSRGADMIIVDRIYDVGEFGLQAQYLVLDPSILRGPKAKFDPSKLHLRMPLAGVAGGGLLAYGELAPEKKEPKMYRGGSTISRALSVAKRYARGGPGSSPWNVRKPSHIPHNGGLIKSSIPGRTDKIPLSVKSGSYIIPSETVSALGENNTMAGGEILTKMLKSGPYGTKAMPFKKARTHFPRLGKPPTRIPTVPKAPKPTFAAGGEADQVPIIAAGGEFVAPPEDVARLGGGDLNRGHKALDAFVLKTRKKHIETLKKLKPPKV